MEREDIIIKSYKTELIVTIIVSLILILISGYLGYYLGSQSRNFEGIPLVFNEEILSIGGFAREINSDSIILETNSLEEVPKLINLTVNILEDTEILNSKESIIDLDDIKIGDAILVESNENIRDRLEINATKVIILQLEIYIG